MNSWSAFIGNPKYVLGLIATIVAIWFLFNPLIIADLINRVIMPLLMNFLVIALMVWGIKIMILGKKK